VYEETETKMKVKLLLAAMLLGPVLAGCQTAGPTASEPPSTEERRGY